MLQCLRLRPLQNVLNSAARIILRKVRDHITADIRDFLHWLPVQQRIEYKMRVLVYKCVHQSALIYFSELCIPVAASAERSHSRSAVHGNLIISYCRTISDVDKEVSLSLGRLYGIHFHLLSLTQFCAKLKSVMFSTPLKFLWNGWR